ncbi:MAG: hypothetical protein F4160_11230 [Rhodospirillaceae bacterium]|nr:hypothetical protein [Rhodospirillaceae bacterium]
MTAILDLTGNPAQVNPDGHGLGRPGQALRLTNAGDDPVFWAIAGRAPTAGVPGFEIGRGGHHEIAVPVLPLWAWAPGRSRVIATPIGQDGR